MIYSNLEFILLFLPTLVLYCLLRSRPVRYWILMVASLIFYAWAGVFDSLVFVSVVMVSWFATWLAMRFPARRHAFLSVGIVILATHLFIWKYFPWLTSQVQRVIPSFLHGEKVSLALPIGISFFTLQGIGYMLDFLSKKASYIPLKQYSLFKAFFPQLVAGPICRSSQLLPQIESLSGPKGKDLSVGLSLFAIGFFKKLFIADTVAPLVDKIFADPSLHSRASLIAGLFGFACQIWADFSGYTDMGRGCARMMGFTLPENFLSPYLSRTPNEFWKRWHITLSQWIRDYIFVPVSQWFPKRGFFQAAMLTMLISGLWHGANWCYVLWGGYHGVLLWIQARLLMSPVSGLARRTIPRPLYNVFLWALMLVATLLGWLIFRSHTVSSIGVYLSSLYLGLGTESSIGELQWIAMLTTLTALMQIFSYCDVQVRRLIFWERLKANAALVRFAKGPIAPALAGFLLAIIFSVGILVSSDTAGRSFIYFQF